MNFKEKELEDYIVSHLDDFVQQSMIYPGPFPEPVLLGRQVPCRYGIIDLLIEVNFSLWVVELKAVRADQKCVGQMRRYQRAIEQVSPYQVLSRGEFDLYADALNPLVELVLVAPSFTPQAIAGVDWPIQTQMENGRFCFETLPGSPYDRHANDQLQSALNPFFEHLYQLERSRLQEESDRILRDSAIRHAMDYTS